MADRRARRANRAGDPDEQPVVVIGDQDTARVRPRRSDGSGRRGRRGGGSGGSRGSVPPDGPAGEDQRRAPGSPRRRRSAGRRVVERQRLRRRRRIRRLVISVVLLLLVGTGAALVLSGLVDLAFLDRARELVTAEPEPEDAAEVGGQQPTLVLVTTGPLADGGSGAHAITVLSHDQETGAGTVLLVPVATVVDAPGHGTFPLAEVHHLGGPALVRLSLANLLGVPLDGVLTLSEDAWAEVLDRIGSIEVTIERRLTAPPSAAPAVRFEPGTHVLDGAGLAAYLTARADGESELEALPRFQQVLAALLDRVAADEEVAAEVASLLVERGTLDGGQADVEVVTALLERLASARADDGVTTLTLPVSPLGDAREDSYQVDTERAEQLVADRFAGARGEDAVGAGTRVQVLSGNGDPQVGQPVAERLSGGGYRILLTGDADRSTYETTRVVVNEATEEQLAVAEDIVARLGTGEIERAATPSSVVDVTIVVGRDFPPG